MKAKPRKIIGVKFFLIQGDIPADMLRYDGAFINERWPSVVAIPKTRGINGTSRGIATEARWNSFCCKVSILSASSFDQSESFTELTESFTRPGWRTFDGSEWQTVTQYLER